MDGDIGTAEPGRDGPLKFETKHMVTETNFKGDPVVDGPLKFFQPEEGTNDVFNVSTTCLLFEPVLNAQTGKVVMFRARTPEGWLVRSTSRDGGICHVPDADHSWGGPPQRGEQVETDHMPGLRKG